MQRRLAQEYRINTFLSFPAVSTQWNVRWWIEADPMYGGVTLELAMQITILATATVGNAATERGYNTTMEVALKLLEIVKAANSVEVLGLDGTGSCVHRDWP